MIDTPLTRSTRWLGLLLLVLGMSLGTAQAQPDKDAPRTDAFSKKQPIHPVLQVQDVNNASLWLRRNGKFDWVDPFSGDNDAYPKGAGSHITFAQGLMWGGKVRDGNPTTIRTNGSTYASGMAPGGMIYDASTGEVTGPKDATNRALHHVWKVDRNWASDEVVRQRAAYFNGVADPSNVSQSAIQETREQFAYDWNNWGDIVEEYNAPYEECNGQAGYQPADPEAVNQGVSCEELDGDIPGRPGADQTMWAVMNDIGSQSDGDVSRNSYGSPAMGMEIQYTIWGYNRPPGDPLGNINFIDARLIYTGLPGGPDDARIDSMFTTWWVDPDVGTFSDDFAGVDTSLSMGYAYSANATDDDFAQEGLPPGAGGWDFLKGPVNAEGDTLGLTSFVFFAAGSDISDPDLGAYAGSLQWFNLMRGLRPRPEYPQGDPFVNPITGEESKFTLPGDPVTGTGWIDGSTLPPGDRRIVNTSGPFEMQKGDTVNVVVGQVRAIGTSNLSSVSRVKFFDTAAQFAFDNNFNIPSPPATPAVSAAELDQQVVLNWGIDNETVNRIETHSVAGFQFQAYRVYQLPSPTASLSEGERIATFDVRDNVRTLVDNVFEQETGLVVTKPVQVLDNTGLKRTLTVTQDRIRDRPLANGVDYHFAVTALSYLPEGGDVPSRILESSPRRLTVRPQPPKPGVAEDEVPSVGQQVPGIEKAQGPGDVNITAEIVDPSRIVNANYTVIFEPVQGECTWTLLQDGSPMLTNEPFGQPQDRKTVNGVKTQVFDGYCAGTGQQETSIFKQDLEAEANTGLDLWGDATLFGAPFGWYSVFNPALPSWQPSIENAKQDLEFRFTGNGGMESPTTEGGQLATYYENAAFAATSPMDLEHNTIRMPFELWETETDTQINFAIIGRNADGNSPWGSGAAPDDGYYRMAARDYIVPIHTEYSQSDVQANGTNPASPEASWLLFFRQSGASVWETGDTYKVQFADPLGTGGDTEYAYSTSPPQVSEEKLSEDVKDITVFPNPYRGFNRLEDSRFDKFVRFQGLPDPADTNGETTIRIFTIAGNPVRVLKHTEDSPSAQYLDWNLKNAGGVPVASGIYLAHINTPVGEKIVKVALVMEEEILRRY